MVCAVELGVDDGVGRGALAGAPAEVLGGVPAVARVAVASLAQAGAEAVADGVDVRKNWRCDMSPA